MAIPRRVIQATRWLALSLLIVLVTAAALYGLLHTRAGLDFAAERLSAALSDEATTVRIGRISGTFHSSLQIEKITVADRAGVYAEAEGLQVQWSPFALLRGTIDIAALTLERLSLTRLPQSEEKERTEGKTVLLPLGIRAGRLSVREISLAAPVLGAAQRMTAEGALNIDSDLARAGVELSLERIDGAADRAKVSLDFASRPARFKANAEIHEPQGGLLARLAGLPAGTPLSVSLSGEGPAEAWRGRLKVDAGTIVSASSSLAVALRDKALGLTLEGSAKLAGLLPAHYRSLVSPGLRLGMEMAFTPGEALKVTRLTAESDAAVLTASGSYGVNDGRLAATVRLKTLNARALAGLVTDLSLSEAEAEAKVAGTVAAPQVDLVFKTGALAHGAVRAAATSGVLAVKPATEKAFDIQGKVSLTGFQASGDIPDGLLGPSLDAAVKGTVRRDGALDAVVLTAMSGPARIEASGAMDAVGTAAGSFALALARIEPLTGAAGLALKGALRADGAFRAALPGGTVNVTAMGVLEKLSGGPDWLVNLLGPRVPFSGTVDWQDGAPLRITGLKIAPAAGQLAATGTLDLKTDGLALDAEVRVPKLEALSRLAGAELGGTLSAGAAVTGTLDRPQARGRALISNLAVDGTSIGDIGTGYSARQDKGGPMALDLRLDAKVLKKPLAGTLQARFPEGRIELRDVDLTYAGNKVSGRLGFDPGSNRLSGALSAEIKEIADIPGAEDVGIRGRGTARISAPLEGKGRIEVTARAERLRRADGTPLPAGISSAEANLTLEDPLGRRSFSGEVTVPIGAARGTAPGKAALGFSGTLAKLDWSSKIATPRPYPAALAMKGTAEFGAPQSRVTVSTLEGDYQRRPFKLQAPVAASFAAGSWRVGPLDLVLAGGRLRVRAAMEGGSLQAEGTVQDLPLRLAALVDDRAAIDGTASGSFRAQGPLARPRITAELSARDIRPLEATREAFTGMTAHLTLTQEGNATRAEGRLKGPKETSVTARLRTAALVGGDAPALGSGDGLPLEGEVEAHLPLGEMAELAGLGGDRVSGVLDGKLDLGGTLGAPRLRGELRLAGGSYEGAATGTILRDVEARAAFTGNEVRLVSLTATDGEKGRLTGEGAVRIAGQRAAEGGLTFMLQRFAALRQPTAEVRASGELKIVGSMTEPRIEGKLTIDGAEIRIPDELGEDIVELDVVEINGPPRPGMAPPPPEDPSLAKTMAVALDVTIEAPGKTFVRGRGLDSEWKGKLEITGTTAEPLIKGKLEAVRGTFAFAGKTFIVKRGSVAFPPGAKPGAEPEISAMAEAKLTDITARIEIAGAISKPSITVSSDPALPQEDVLAKILFGKTGGQLTAIQAAQLVQTAATLSGKAGGPGIVDKVRSAIGVDVLSVESGEGDKAGASLKAGNYLTEDVFLSVTQGTQPGSQKVGVEVKVVPHVTVESNVSGNAASNIGVNWKWDY